MKTAPNKMSSMSKTITPTSAPTIVAMETGAGVGVPETDSLVEVVWLILLLLVVTPTVDGAVLPSVASLTVNSAVLVSVVSPTVDGAVLVSLVLLTVDSAVLVSVVMLTVDNSVSVSIY